MAAFSGLGESRAPYIPPTWFQVIVELGGIEIEPHEDGGWSARSPDMEPGDWAHGSTVRDAIEAVYRGKVAP